MMPRSTTALPAILLLAAEMLSIPTLSDAEAPLSAEIVDTSKIWDGANHNAFTDLIVWSDVWYCVFREATNHAGSQGVLRVLRSEDGKTWKSAAVLSDPVYDLRDAKLSITPENSLLIIGGAQADVEGERRTGTITARSADGAEWSKPEVVVEPGRWVWDLAWRDGFAWGVSYGTPDGHGVNTLVRTTDGRRFETYVEDFFSLTPYPNEARIRFAKDGAAYCLQRSDGEQNAAYLGVSQPPYKEWEWKNLGRSIGGPSLLQLPSGAWVAAGRIFEGDKPKTAVLCLDVESGSVGTVAVLPSGGDCSYPGLVWRDGLLWVSYYSSHDGKTSVYLSRLEISGAE